MDPPDLFVIPATPLQEIDPAESAIVTIYSMYTDQDTISPPLRKLPFIPNTHPVPRPLPPINHSPSNSIDRPQPVPPTPTSDRSLLSRSRSRSPRNRSRPPSPDRKSAFINRDLPPVPTPSDPPRSRPPTPPSRSPSRSHSPSSSPPPPLPPPPFSHSRSTTSSPSPKSPSLTPTPGEDPDAFLVRCTYAQLELQGVKGDGYEDGVERTRAKVGPSRASQLNAELALGDKSAKTGELNPKERETLASLDRYGFFSIPSHDRLVLLPSAQLLKRITPIPIPPLLKPSLVDPKPLNTLPPLPLPPKETSRIAKWNRMLLPSCRDIGGNIESWAIKSSKERKLRERIYKGIPDRWRTAAWDLLMRRSAGIGKLEVAKLINDYSEALEKPSSYDIQIDLDVPRTISGHVMFHTRYGAGQRALFHVLHSFSLRCPDCGYVQGMGPIAATLLCYFEPERVYVCLIRLHDSYGLHRLFSPGFPGLLEAIYVQERVTERMMPEVYASFRKHMISTTSYATKWYITLFANSVPFQTQLRLWDAFLCDGPDVFVAVAVAIVWVYRDQITSDSANFETVLSLLSSFFVPEDENELLLWIERTLADKKLRSDMTQWRQDWQRLVHSGKDGSALL